MKKIFFFTCLFASLTLTGCLELTQELTIKEDGSGEINGKMDMSAMMAMLAQMGGTGKDTIAIDSTIAFSSLLDSARDLSADDKILLKDAVMRININSKEEVLMITNKTPFKQVNDIEKIGTAMKKWNQSGAMEKALSSAFGDKPANMGEKTDEKDNPFSSVPEEYFDLKCSDGKITRTLKKDKYATLGEDQVLSKMKEAGEMGSTVKSNFIINLPRPVKSFTGKNVKLSEDKKKVTVENTLDELFDDATKYEFTIEY